MSQSHIHCRIADHIELNRFYKDLKDGARARQDDLMYAAIVDNEIIATVRILPYDNFFLIRSLLVHPHRRRQGIAYQLMQFVLKNIKGQLIAIPTPMAQKLYNQLGFSQLPNDQIPAQLITSYRRVRQSDQGAPVMAIEV